MLLRLKQMIGRLIRTPADRGITIVVEPRCDRAYFEKVLGALPPRAAHRRARMPELKDIVAKFVARAGCAASDTGSRGSSQGGSGGRPETVIVYD
jgi:hypothetical protein